MSSLSITFAVVVVAVFVVLQCSSQAPAYVPNEAEKKICEDRAAEKGTTLNEAKKDRPQSCKIVCYYADGTESTENSPNGQLCCDVVGVAPTGMCKDGKCPVGGIGK